MIAQRIQPPEPDKACPPRIADQRVPRSFYNRSADTVARDLLGRWLVHDAGGAIRVGRIVETEAYLGPHDRACHSARGRTPRTEVMFGPPGFAYVYMIYGMHFCMNVTTEPEGVASAVLLRAIEPVHGLADGARGPGLVCRTMGIDRGRNGCDLGGGDLFIATPSPMPPIRIVRRPRIGVQYAGPRWSRRLLRFYIRSHPFVSKR